MVSFAMMVHFVMGLLLFGVGCMGMVKSWSDGYGARVMFGLTLFISVGLIWMGMDIYAGKLDPNSLQWNIPR